MHAENDSVFINSCIKGEKEFVKFLIENGANVYTYGNTAFNESCKNGYIEIEKLII